MGKIAPQDKLVIMKTLCSLFLDRLLYAVYSNIVLFVHWESGQGAQDVKTTCSLDAHFMTVNLYIFVQL